MVAYIRKLAVEQKGWLEPGEFSEGAAFCQMVPGATAMQTAAYVGLRIHGVAGAAASFIGFGLPAFLLMLFFALVYTQTGRLPAVLSVFSGLQAAVVAIVANAALSFGKATLKTWPQFLIASAAALLFWINLHPLFVILGAAAAGWLILPRPDPSELRGSASSPIPFQKKPIFTILACAAGLLLGLYFFSIDLFKLALLMLRVDLLAFGGGLASVPIMYQEVVGVNQWLDGPTFMNGIILGQVTPGPVVITATFIGYLLQGIGGALAASLYIFLPSFLMVAGLFPFFHLWSRSPTFYKVIQGVLCSFVGLLVSVALRFGLQVTWDWIHVLLAAGALAALIRRVDILWVVLVGTVLSILLIH